MKKIKTRILIVDDHAVIRDGLRLMLINLDTRLVINVDDAANANECLRKVARRDYDIIFMDYQFPGMTGSYLTREILKIKPGQKVLAISNYDEASCVAEMLKAGVKGYISKGVKQDELVEAIDKVLEGRPHYSPEIAVTYIQSTFDRKDIPKNQEIIKHVPKSLTNRETQVIRYIAKGFSSKDMAEALCLSPRTIDSHRRNLMIKLKVKNAAGAIREAIRLNILNNE